MAFSASEGTALTTSTTRWLRTVRREVVAGVLPQGNPTRSGRILRNLVTVGLKLMTTDLPPELFSCTHCMDSDGRYKWVSADSIWVGFGSGAEHVRFDHVSEEFPENRRAVKAAYLVRGESVRRMVRDVMKPSKPIKLLARSTRPAELAAGILLPKALPEGRTPATTEGERAISAIIGAIFDVDAASAKLLSSLKTALATFKTRSRVEAARRAAAASHLQAYIAKKKAADKGVSQGTPSGAAARALSTPSAGVPTTIPPRPPPCAAPHASNGASSPSRTEAASARDHPSAATLTVDIAARNALGVTPAPGADAAPTAGAAGEARPEAPRPIAPPLSLTLPASVEKPATAPKSTTRKKLTRRPDCGRKPFKAGKGDVDADSPFFLPAVLQLDKDSRRELLSFVTAITIDIVVLPFRPAHVQTLRQLATLLRGEEAGAALSKLLALSTADRHDGINEGSTRVVELLSELRFVQLGLRACSSIFKHLPELPGVLADGLCCVAASIERFVAEWRAGSDPTVAYQHK